MTAFSPLHNHTEYSSLDGVARLDEIGAHCRCLGCSAVGITDHATVAGHLEAARVLPKYGVKPIFGCELYHGVKTEFDKNERDQSHFIALAMTDQGLRNLWSLVSAAATNFRYVGRVNWDMLDKYNEGLVATSACIQGLVPKGIMQDDFSALNRYQEIFGDRFYIELHTYPGEEHELLNYHLVQTAAERGIGLVYATDAHRARKDQYELADTYVAMNTGECVYMDPDSRKMWHPEESLYIMDEQEIREALSYLPESAVDEALQNTAEIADMAAASLPGVSRHLPAFIPKACPWLGDDAPETAAELLIQLVETGVVERYGEGADQEIWDRAMREMEVFLEPGLEHYFLQAWDFCKFCDANGIRRGPGRGSAAGSLVAYALGITDVDPLHYGLIFERFYNPGRAKGFPDIDNDFPQKDRKRVREYLMDRWGEDKVCTIGTTTRLKPKSALEKTYKALAVTWDEMTAVKKIVGETPDIDILGVDSIGWDRDVDPGVFRGYDEDGNEQWAPKTIYVMEHVGEEIRQWVKDQPANRHDILNYWLEITGGICSRVAGYGVHPSGVVVSDVVLADELPCMWNSNQGIKVTCFPMDDVDARQFVKQDFLGLRNLDVLQCWEDQIGEQGITIDWHNLDKQDHPDEMWEMLDKGLTLGIFQVEDGYARKLCKELRPRSVEDLSMIGALNRPGPIRSGAPASFITRRNGEEDDLFDGRKIPMLADILEPTYGWFLYQEQVIAYFSKLGYDLSDADAVRKILGKKKPEEMAALREGAGEWSLEHTGETLTITPVDEDGEAVGEPFVITNKGYKEVSYPQLGQETADTIWEKLEDFAKYSFNKSHSVSYGILGFRTLFAKYYATQEFVIACIRTINDSTTQDKMKRIGALVAEARRMGITIKPPDIVRSVTDISVTDEVIYFGLSNVKGVGKGTSNYVVKLRKHWDISSPDKVADAMEDEIRLHENAKARATEAGESFKKKSPRQQFNTKHESLLYDAGAYDNYGEREDVKLNVKQKHEKELLGVILSDECEQIFANNAELVEECVDNWADLLTGDVSRVRIPGTIDTITPKKTKKDNKAMGIVSIVHDGEEVEVVVFPQQWASHRFMWKERTPGIFTVKVSERGVQFEEGLRLQ